MTRDDTLRHRTLHTFTNLRKQRVTESLFIKAKRALKEVKRREVMFDFEHGSSTANIKGAYRSHIEAVNVSSSDLVKVSFITRLRLSHIRLDYLLL